ncbi:MAG: hypothetical protein IJZ64_09065 [Ruminococcus sp.]|nr:hypothetical protein [Ruminococcus sp.]
MWKNLYVDGATGVENGVIMKDEEYKGLCRITLENCSGYFVITCGIYDKMFHIVFCNVGNFQRIYEEMKQDLQDFLDKDSLEYENIAFYRYFKSKF